jgi:hypothetical protein
MPKVPVSDNVIPFSPGSAQPMPSQTDFAMAAAMMHSQGKLFEFPDAAKFSAEVLATQRKQRE